jgi:DNA polymerase III subunit epsilon
VLRLHDSRMASARHGRGLSMAIVSHASGHRALSDTEAALFLLTLPLPTSGRLGLTALLECARRQFWVVRAEDTSFERRASLKARGYRCDNGEGKRLVAHDQRSAAELDWLRADIYGDDRHVTVLKAPATRRYSSRLWAE